MSHCSFDCSHVVESWASELVSFIYVSLFHAIFVMLPKVHKINKCSFTTELIHTRTSTANANAHERRRNNEKKMGSRFVNCIPYTMLWLSFYLDCGVAISAVSVFFVRTTSERRKKNPPINLFRLFFCCCRCFDLRRAIKYESLDRRKRRNKKNIAPCDHTRKFPQTWTTKINISLTEDDTIKKIFTHLFTHDSGLCKSA